MQNNLATSNLDRNNHVEWIDIDLFEIPKLKADISKIDAFTICMKNTSSLSSPAVLFGYNENFLSANFGNSQGIEIKVMECDYKELLAYSCNKPLTFGMARFSVSEEKQLSKAFTITKSDATGMCTLFPFEPMRWKSPFSMQANVIDIEHLFIIDGSTKMNFTLLPNSESRLTFMVSKPPLDPFNSANARQEKRSQRKEARAERKAERLNSKTNKYGN